MPSGCAVGKAWTDGLAVVTVPRGAPKTITLVYPYYRCPQFFLRQQAHWNGLPDALREHLRVIVVDDGSPEPIQKPTASMVDLRIFRIGVDVRWNWLAARNVGAHHAADGWLLLTDMDHVVPAETLDALIHGAHDPAVVYAFHRREHTGTRIKCHSASFFLTRDLFWKIGGYDERGSGFYGNDGVFRRQVSQHATIQILTDVLERHEYVADSSVTTYGRKEAQDRIQTISRGWTGAPKTLSFPYEEVTL